MRSGFGWGSKQLIVFPQSDEIEPQYTKFFTKGYKNITKEFAEKTADMMIDTMA